MVVNLGEFPPEGRRIPESGLKVVSYALSDHRNLFRKVRKVKKNLVNISSFPTKVIRSPKGASASWAIQSIFFLSGINRPLYHSHAAHQEEEVKDCKRDQQVVEVALEAAPVQLEISFQKSNYSTIFNNITIVPIDSYLYLTVCAAMHHFFFVFSLSLRPAGSLHSLISLFHWLIPLISLVLKGQRISMSEDQNKEPAETATARVSVKKLLQLIVISI